MIKKIALALFLFSLSFNSLYAAPQVQGKSDIGINFGIAAFSDDTALDPPFMFIAKYAYGIDETIAVGIEAGYYGEASYVRDGIDLGDVVGVPLMVDFIYRWKNDSPAIVYGLIGFGTVIWDFSKSSTVNSAQATADAGASFSIKLGGGVDYYLNDRWAINVEGGYVFSSEAITITGAGSVPSSKVDLDHWYIGAGLKYLFE